MSTGDDERPRAVFDTMIYLQAAARPSGPAAACLRFVEEGRIRLEQSADTLKEVADVLSRPEIRQKNPRLTEEVVTKYLTHLVGLAPPWADVSAGFTYPRDPKDERFIDLAIAAKVPVVVSWDNDLRDLNAEGNAAGADLRARIPGFRVLTPPEILNEVRAREAETRALKEEPASGAREERKGEGGTGTPPAEKGGDSA